MIDIHTHILPGIDDGPEDMEETLAMCRIAVEDGITDVIATPHMLKAPYDVSREAVLEKVAELNARLAGEGLSLKIHAGAEIYISPEIPGLLREGRRFLQVEAYEGKIRDPHGEESGGYG